MNKLVLKYIGEDDWSRTVYEDENGIIFKDTNCGMGTIALCTCGSFDGEPNTPIEYIEKYEGVEIEIVGDEEEPTKEEKFNYMMLDRLRQDCEYYLGYGNRNKKHLWANNEQNHINEMKRIYNWFDEDKKPQWITMNDILEYENKMNLIRN